MDSMEGFSLDAWVEAWQERYPRRTASQPANEQARTREALRLSRFSYMTVLSQPDADELVRWKFDTYRARRAKALKGIDDEHWHHAERRIAEALQVAHACPGLDRPPLLLLSDTTTGVGGWGVAMGSAVLAACFPHRFSVGDAKALASVQALNTNGYLPIEVPPGKDFAFRHWEPYLGACRWLSGTCKKSLREVDQALWAAAGNLGMPS